MNKSKLKPCPFCGNTQMVIEPVDGENDDHWFVWCKSRECPIDYTQVYGDTKQEAIKKWNKRSNK